VVGVSLSSSLRRDRYVFCVSTFEGFWWTLSSHRLYLAHTNLEGIPTVLVNIRYTYTAESKGRKRRRGVGDPRWPWRRLGCLLPFRRFKHNKKICVQSLGSWARGGTRGLWWEAAFPPPGSQCRATHHVTRLRISSFISSFPYSWIFQSGCKFHLGCFTMTASVLGRCVCVCL
jgi:hypothetical protein